MDVDTIEPMVVPPPARGRPPTSGDRRVLWWLIPLVVLFLGLPGLLNADLPYYEISPGSSRPVGDLVHAPADKLHPPKGQVLYATVSLGPVKPLEFLRAKLDRNSQIVGERAVLGKTPPRQYRQENQQAMDDSKQAAIVLALRRLGYPVPERGSGTLVEEVEDATPAAGKLKAGDVITAIDGQPTLLSQDAVGVIHAHHPGDSVTLSVTGPDGVARSVPLVLGAKPKTTDVAFLGVLLRTKDQKFDLPFDVSIDTFNIGGPSAGLAFTLAVLDELSPGELTGGHKVAVTGTIDLDGTVGPVGGVAQKTAAVCSAGAEYFLVPPDEFKTASSHACSRLKVMRVTTLDDAISVLGRIGGDVSALATAPNGAKG